jgi:hypothetical protein
MDSLAFLLVRNVFLKLELTRVPIKHVLDTNGGARRRVNGDGIAVLYNEEEKKKVDIG